MNNAELIDDVAAKTGLKKKDVKAALESVTDAVAFTLSRGGSVTFAGLGRFGVGRLAARIIVHPSTGSPMLARARKKPKFDACKAFEIAVRGY